MTLNKFLKSENLILTTKRTVVKEPKWYASINAEAMSEPPGLLTACTGFGNTKKEAVANLTRFVSGKMLLVDCTYRIKAPTLKVNK
jgi:hypothetical protein